MIADSVKFRGFRCFQEEWSGFDEIKPVNVIIGRNNTGKSHLLKLVEFLCDAPFRKHDAEFQCRGVLDEQSLKRHFNPNHSGGALGGNHWQSHGHHFVDQAVTWAEDKAGTISQLDFNDDFNPNSPNGDNSTNERNEVIGKILREAVHCLRGMHFRHLLADRDIAPERVSPDQILGFDGRGATNIVRRFITNSELDRDVIQKLLLTELNKIFEPDATFTEIEIQVHEGDHSERDKDRWEIFLGEDTKNIVALSASGSGLKTVFLVLLNLLVVPIIISKKPKGIVFAFEELENNLHPALLRRLFAYLENYAVDRKSTIFLTTHSNVALDMYGKSDNAQIIRVEHNGRYAVAKTVKTHFERFSVVTELGLKPSDLLQANGIIWVEGPSDRVYLNRWIELFSDGEFQEGRDYQCAFYGGALLARNQFTAPEEADIKEFANLLWVNPRLILVADGDRTADDGKGSRIKEHLRRVKGEIEKVEGAHLWITDAKEIENYIPGPVLGQLFSNPKLPDPGRFEYFFPTKASNGKSYLERRAKHKAVSKTDLALAASELMDKESLSVRFDLQTSVQAIIVKIRGWNK